MKKLYIIILTIFMFSYTTISSQINELGVFLGGSNYIGDIGSTNYIFPNNYAVGGIYKWNLHPRFSLRATYTYAKISGDDAKSGNSYREYRGRSFSNSVHELAAGIEFNFFKYNLSKIGYTNTPYIIVEAAVSNYDTREKGRTFNYTMPFGLGYKMRLAHNVGIAIETSFRYTFKDDIDGYYNGLTYESVDGSGYPVIKTIDDSNGNDWYVFTGITIVYAFGREGCYTGNF